MSRYVPNTPADQISMLESIGYKSIDDLFADIPDTVKIKDKLNLPDAISEMELAGYMRRLAGENKNIDDYICFLGAGAYDHYIPSVIHHITGRSEFYTAYTPYQPEISQGTLQTIFEYQTMICELTGMDVANASLYDGATALAEAAFMACGITRRDEVLVSDALHPEYREVLKTYSKFRNIKVNNLKFTEGRIDLDQLKSAVSKNTAAVIIQSPNFFGAIEAIDVIAQIAHDYKALLIVCVDPISLALLEPAGKLGADIVTGEGQALGNELSLGGPYLGFFATTQKYMRRMPGRIVGQTTDEYGRRGYVLTIQTREQHIRRDKATSNVCSNENLNALAAAVYMTVMGRQGLKEVAMQSLNKAHYAFNKIISIPGITPLFSAPFFKEFAVKLPISPEKLNKKLLSSGIIGGYSLAKDYPLLDNGWLIAVTEKRTKQEIDFMCQKVGEIINEG